LHRREGLHAARERADGFRPLLDWIGPTGALQWKQEHGLRQPAAVARPM